MKSSRNYKISDIITSLEKGLEEIHEHYKSWKVRINPAKTEAILLTKSPKMLSLILSEKIVFCGKAIEWQSSVRYLGVILDKKLLFRANIEKNIAKAKGVLSKIYGLIKKNSGLPTYEKITLYRSLIRPILTYACPCFAHAAKTHVSKLQIFQNKCLRMALNAPYRTRISSLHRRAHIPMIDKFIVKLTKSFYEKSKNSNNKLIQTLGCRHKSISQKQKHKMPRSFF